MSLDTQSSNKRIHSGTPLTSYPFIVFSEISETFRTSGNIAWLQKKKLQL
jgi:hypothetical protein